jgi:acetoin utilization deacetylase AcuC-like enzyme
MLPFKLIYHPRYDLNLGAHVFPSQKFRLIAETLFAEKIATQEDFLEPQPASDEDMLRVHGADWVRKLKTGTLTPYEAAKLEVPYSTELRDAVWLAAGGTILAAQSAMRIMARDSARFTTWPSRFVVCRPMARFAKRW